MQPGAIGAPMLVDLGISEGAAVRGPDWPADADVGDGFNVAAGGDVANAQLEPLRSIVVDQGGGVAPVRADLHRTEPEILLARRFGTFIENGLRFAARGRPPIPCPILRARAERPPIEEVAVADRDRA